MDIVLPCYNPQPDWEKRIIQSYEDICQRTGNKNISVYLVNDGSSRGIEATQIDALKAVIPSFYYLTYNLNRGKGYALRKGVKASKGDLCIYTDVDFPFKEESFLSIYNVLMTGTTDVAIGVRDDVYYKNVPKVRIAISKTLRFFTRNFLGMKINDTQCGLKGFNAKGKEIFISTSISRYLFDLEFVHKISHRKDIRLTPVLVHIKDGIVFSKMNSKILFNEGTSFLGLLLKHYFSRG